MSKSQLEEIERKQVLPYMKAIGPEYKKQDIYRETANIFSNILYTHEQIRKNANEVPPLPCMHENDYAESVVRRLLDYRSDIVNNFYERSAYVKRMTFSKYLYRDVVLDKKRDLIRNISEDQCAFILSGC